MIIKNILSFIKKIFIKEKSVKSISAPIEKPSKESRDNFITSLKANVTSKRKTNVETQVCVGDGLGIQNKVNF